MIKIYPQYDYYNHMRNIVEYEADQKSQEKTYKHEYI